jgi:hypothetical protein
MQPAYAAYFLTAVVLVSTEAIHQERGDCQTTMLSIPEDQTHFCAAALQGFARRMC